MGAEPERLAARPQHRLDERAEIGNPAIVADHQLVELPPAGDVLILEGARAPLLARSQHPRDDGVVDRRQLGARPGEETRQPSVPLGDGLGARGSERQRPALAGQAIETLGVRAAGRNSPQHVAEVLLDQRNLGLHGQLDVGQRGGASRLRLPPGGRARRRSAPRRTASGT